MGTATLSKDQCIENCQTCQTTIQDMLTRVCLKEGGSHVEQEHVKLMLDCAAACSACVDFMSRNSDFHSHYCRACAEICDACAKSCQQVGDMDACVECCRNCHESCSAMAA